MAVPGIDCVVLAAGLSSRAGGFKPLFACNGSTLIQQTIGNFLPFCGRIIVVAGYRINELRAVLAGYIGIEVHQNPRFADGMFSSVQCGVAQVRTGRFFLIPGDMPLIQPDLIAQLLATPGDVVLPSFQGRSGHPALLSAALIPQILAEPANSNLRAVLARQAKRFLVTGDAGCVFDVDTADDYLLLKSHRLTGVADKGITMNDAISWVINPQAADGAQTESGLVDPVISAEVKQFHESFNEYSLTPLRSLGDLAAGWGIGGIHVKDESQRFGLNAFKVLGASYAMGKSLAKRLGRPLAELPFNVLKSPQVRQALGNPVFAATTDGNHGRGVAWTAAQLGFDSHIYMPKGTTATRFANIEKLGGKVQITDWNYDETVRWVAGQAQANNWEIIQDTAWEGYVDVPRWIMQGYSTVAREAIGQMGGTVPSHVFLQAGVGAFAAVMALMVRAAWPQQPPKIIIMEAKPAECFYQSIKAGRKTSVTGDLNTIMAGLACGEPNPLAWDILRQLGAVFVACPDWVAAQGMRILGNPAGGDSRVVSGESGAVGVGLLEAALANPAYSGLRGAIGLGAQSQVLLFSTEGDTDPEVYRQVVWAGAYPAVKTTGGKPV